MSHAYVGNVVEKGDGEDAPEWELDWLLYLEQGALRGVTARVYALPGRTLQLDCVQSPRS